MTVGRRSARSVSSKALAECACVDEACRRVGRSPSSAYALRRRPDAQGFRVAWDAALDYGVRRLTDAAFSRALNGVARPVFFQGEQIGERRYFDERLTMFLLRYRDPVRYGAWLDRTEARRHPDGAALGLALAVDRIPDDALEAGADGGPPRKPLELIRDYAPAACDDDDEDPDAEEAALNARISALLDEAEAEARVEAQTRAAARTPETAPKEAKGGGT